MDNKQVELVSMYILCGVKPKEDGLFYEKGSTMPFTGNKIAYGKTLFGLIKSKIKRAEMTFENGKQHGPMKLWYKDGNKWLDMGYHKGEPHGWRRLWYENGEVEEESLFEYGVLVEQKNRPNIQILNMFMESYKISLESLGVDITNKKDKKSIESYLFTEKLIVEEKLRNATGNEKTNLNKLINMIDLNKDDIIDFINQNV